MDQKAFDDVWTGALIRNRGSGQAYVVLMREVDKEGRVKLHTVRYLDATNASEWELVQK